ncbi:MAG: ABC transporter ATP-binding protein [Candidatus Sumerlaeia bacterium]
MTETVPAIRTVHLKKKYGEHLALRDLSVEVQPGEIFCYLGPNGAGKTTTIKILTGLLRPTEGHAEILGCDIQKEPVKAKQQIGYIPDHPYLYEKLTGREFFYFIGDLFGIERKRADERLVEYFDIFGLTGAEDSFIENYSHGMRQKLVFSVSLMHEPRVLVVDEPMVGLDPQSARVLKRLLQRKVDEEGLAVFLSTHTLSVAAELADRIGVLHHGELIFSGSLQEMREQLGEAKNLEEMFLSLTGVELEPEEIE